VPSDAAEAGDDGDGAEMGSRTAERRSAAGGPRAGAPSRASGAVWDSCATRDGGEGSSEDSESFKAGQQQRHSAGEDRDKVLSS